MPVLTARALKATIVLDANEVAELRPAENQARTLLKIRNGERTFRADVATKAVRKAVTMVRENGVEAVAVLIQGKLAADDSIEGAGLAAQPRAPKEAEPAATAKPEPNRPLPPERQEPPMQRPFMDAPGRN